MCVKNYVYLLRVDLMHIMYIIGSLITAQMINDNYYNLDSLVTVTFWSLFITLINLATWFRRVNIALRVHL